MVGSGFVRVSAGLLAMQTAGVHASTLQPFPPTRDRRAGSNPPTPTTHTHRDNATARGNRKTLPHFPQQYTSVSVALKARSLPEGATTPSMRFAGWSLCPVVLVVVGVCMGDGMWLMDGWRVGMQGREGDGGMYVCRM